MREASWSARMVAVVVALTITATVIISANLYWTALNNDLSRNEHVYSEIGRVVRDGGLPYRDTWDHKPPVLYYVLAASIFVFGNTAFAIHVVGVAVGLAFSMVIAGLARQLTGSWRAAGLAGVAGLFYGSVAAAKETGPDMLMVMLGTAAFLVAVAGRGRVWWLVVSGLLLAAAFFAKQPVILQLPPLLWIAAWAAPRRAWRAVAAVLTGLAAGILLVIGWAAAQGITGAFWYQAFEANFLYSLDSNTEWHFQSSFGDLFVTNFVDKTLPYLLPLIVLAIPAIVLLSRRDSQRTILWINGMWLVTATGGAMIGRALSPAYFSQVVPALIVLVALAVPLCSRLAWRLAMLSTIIAVLMIVQYPGQLTIPDLRDRHEEARSLQPVIAIIQQHSDPHDCIWTWGEFEAYFNYYAQRDSCTRQLQSMPMMVPEAFDILRNRRDYMQDLIQSDPKLLVRSWVWGFFPELEKYAERYRGPRIFHNEEISIYEVDRSSWVPVYVNFSNTIALLGIDLYQRDLIPGTDFTLAFTWKAIRPVNTGYSLAIKLVSDDGQVLARYDGLPAGDRPTETWQVQGDILLGDVITLPVPDDLAPGHYRLVAGLYSWETLDPLLIQGDAGAVDPALATLAEFDFAGND